MNAYRTLILAIENGLNGWNEWMIETLVETLIETCLFSTVGINFFSSRRLWLILSLLRFSMN